MSQFGRQTLPVEIWREIIHFAGAIPREDDMSPSQIQQQTYETSHLSLNYLWSSEGYLRALKRALRIRGILVRVSRMWQALATPILYSSLLVNRGNFTSICLALEPIPSQYHRTGDSGLQKVSRGRYTRVIILNCGKSHESIGSKLDLITRMCPNLLVIHLHPHGEGRLRWTRFAETHKRLQVFSITNANNIIHMQSTLDSIPSYKSLLILEIRNDKLLFQVKCPLKVNLPNLHTLVIQARFNIFDELTTWSTPELRNLSVVAKDASLGNFIRSRSKTLEFLCYHHSLEFAVLPNPIVYPMLTRLCVCMDTFKDGENLRDAFIAPKLASFILKLECTGWRCGCSDLPEWLILWYKGLISDNDKRIAPASSELNLRYVQLNVKVSHWPEFTAGTTRELLKYFESSFAEIGVDFRGEDNTLFSRSEIVGDRYDTPCLNMTHYNGDNINAEDLINI